MTNSLGRDTTRWKMGISSPFMIQPKSMHWTETGRGAIELCLGLTGWSRTFKWGFSLWIVDGKRSIRRDPAAHPPGLSQTCLGNCRCFRRRARGPAHSWETLTFLDSPQLPQQNRPAFIPCLCFIDCFMTRNNLLIVNLSWGIYEGVACFFCLACFTHLFNFIHYSGRTFCILSLNYTGKNITQQTQPLLY